MKKFIGGVVGLGLIGSMMAGAAQAAAVVWVPTDSDINLITFRTTAPSVDIAIFDDTDTAFLDPLTLTLTPNSALTVKVADTGGGLWTFSHGGDAISVTDGSFVFAAATAGGGWDDTLVSYSAWGGNTWEISLTNSVFLAVDVRPVPLPPAVWLFGAGLIGLAGVARRR